MQPTDRPGPRRKRRHPAKRARIATGLLSVAGLVGFTGYLTANTATTSGTTVAAASVAADTATTAATTASTTSATTASTTADHRGDHRNYDHCHHGGGEGVDRVVLGQHLQSWQLNGSGGPWAATPT